MVSIEIWLGSIGVLILAISAGFAAFRHRHASTVLQAVGALGMLASGVMGHLRITHIKKYPDKLYHIEPAWVWDMERYLWLIGLVVFAVGYLWYWLSLGRRKANWNWGRREP